MTEQEVIKEITSKPKFYIGIMPQSTASLFLKRFNSGSAKRSTIISFAKKYGYEVDSEISFKKVI